MMPGTKLGSYEILAPLGAGGMGEVYRARDAKLDREVAIKVLPASFAQNADRMARFRREAKVLASLNHPNIAAIYGVEDSESTDALVMELVEGPTLAERIRQGPIPIDEALPIARQIADALEYAHERGVVHRDLKPANIKVSRDDAVKILDFGLAKAVEGEATARVNGDSPTISELATQAGVLLGTAAYMAPEQAKGKPVDRRADVWAFGCVLFEMLTGKKAFSGETTAETLAAVLANEPDWSQLPASTPIHVRVLLRRCLQKDPKQRLRDIGDARISLDEVLTGAPEATLASAAPVWRRLLPWAITGALAIALAAVGFFYSRQKPAVPRQLLRYDIFPPEKTTFGPAFALSPDGRHLAFTVMESGGRPQLWVRDLDSLASHPLADVTSATRSSPFWSPDSREVAFRTRDKLERVAVSGGAPQVVCNSDSLYGGSWNADGEILFGTLDGLMKVSASGGTPSMMTKVEASRGEIAHMSPWFLPDGRRFLYVRTPGPESGTYMGSLDRGTDQTPSKPLIASFGAAYVPGSGSGPGRILFLTSDRTLMVQSFDASRARLEGDPFRVAQGVDRFTVSATGVLAYTSGSGVTAQLTWFDRQGKILGTVGEPGVYPRPALSPDGRVVAVSRPNETGGNDLWLYDLARGTRSRFTFDGTFNDSPVWSPDGARIAFSSSRGAPMLFVKAVNGMGGEQPLAKASGAGGFWFPTDWSSDGRYLVEEHVHDTSSIWLLPLSAQQPNGERKSVPYLKDRFNETSPTVSPNGKWMAYDSDETGRDEIFVQTFPKPGGKWQVSTDGGTRPVWSRDGKELYFIDLSGILTAVEVKNGPAGSLEASRPKALFDAHMGVARLASTFAVSKDGRFLIPVTVGKPGGPITVVVNWQAALKQ